MNRRELRITGMSRSGNHAIINWILRQATGRFCFLNCTEPKFNPFETARPLDDGRRFLTNIPDFDPEAEKAGRFSDKELLIYSHEDCFLGTIAKGPFEDDHDALVGESAQRTDVLILRDPYNLFASRMKGGFGTISNGTAMRIWKQHAREFLGIRRYLRLPRVLISYNRWATDSDYRGEVARQLGVSSGDLGIQQVPPAGNGSSFDGRRYDGRAARMQVLSRWRHFEDDRRFERLFDRTARQLAREIFGDLGFPAAASGNRAANRHALPLIRPEADCPRS